MSQVLEAVLSQKKIRNKRVSKRKSTSNRGQKNIANFIKDRENRDDNTDGEYIIKTEDQIYNHLNGILMEKKSKPKKRFFEVDRIPFKKLKNVKNFELDEIINKILKKLTDIDREINRLDLSKKYFLEMLNEYREAQKKEEKKRELEKDNNPIKDGNSKYEQVIDHKNEGHTKLWDYSTNEKIYNGIGYELMFCKRCKNEIFYNDNPETQDSDGHHICGIESVYHKFYEEYIVLGNDRDIEGIFIFVIF